MIVLKATQDKVLSVLQSVAGIVERRHTLPILANVLIRKTGKTLSWVAFRTIMTSYLFLFNSLIQISSSSKGSAFLCTTLFSPF